MSELIAINAVAHPQFKSISEAAGAVASIAQALGFVRPLFESLIR